MRRAEPRRSLRLLRIGSLPGKRGLANELPTDELNKPRIFLGAGGDIFLSHVQEPFLSDGTELLEATNMAPWGSIESNRRPDQHLLPARVRSRSQRRRSGFILPGMAAIFCSSAVVADGPAAARIRNDASTSGYLRIADHPGLEPQQFTIECRITPRGPGSGNVLDAYGATIIAKPMEGAGGFTITSYLLMWSPVTNKLVANVAEALPGSAGYLFSVGTVPTNTTAHVAMTLDGATLRLYINGVLDSSMAFPWSAVAYGAQDVLIGAGNYCCGFLRRFDGEIDDVRIWDHARTAAQIAAGMNNEVTGPTPGLLAAWNFNCGDYRDASGNGRNATPIGSVSLVTQDPALVTPPLAIAVAGDDQSAPEGSTVHFDGGASTSTCGEPGYAWSQIAGPSVSLVGSGTATPSFATPAVPLGGAVLTFQLVVTDGSFESVPDSVNVHVTNVNNAPVAVIEDLCGPLAVAEAGIATLDASHSYDIDDEPLGFHWEQTSGPPVTLDLTDPAKPTFATPFVGPAGEELTFIATVTDGEASNSKLVFVCVVNTNHAPVADAGAAQTVAEGSTVTLDATASYDQDGDELAFAWAQVSDSAVLLSGANTASPTFTAPMVGLMGEALVFVVTVDDGYGGSDSAAVVVTVVDSSSPPECGLATPSKSELWPPNHKLVPITINAVTSASNPAVSITILGVTQDEPVNGTGDGDTSPDAVIQGNTVLLRAERSGGGNGRVYRVSFEALDGFGNSCTGSILVRVPHDKGKNTPPAIDDGQFFNSLAP